MPSSTAADRGQWGSRFGFVLAAAGSAVGLGNIWRFPYVTGQSGGAAFVAIYLVCVFLICLPYLFAELTLGRHSNKNPVGAIRAIRGKTPWVLVGALCILTGVFILSYYSVIAGWTVGYVFKQIVAPSMEFGTFIASPMLVIPLFALFILMTVLIVVGGVEKGIERWSKILMPALLVIMLIVSIRGVTLPGAIEGLRFYLQPDFSKVDGAVILAALGQAFFSLSLGMGAMITYGSYLPKRENILASGAYVASFDAVIALLAGFMIFPAIFAVGAQPDAGPALVFIVLPQVFAEMPFGMVVGILFFTLLAIAALTSTVSLLEVVVSYFVDERRWSRKKAVWILGGVTFVVGLPSALSQGAVAGLSDMSYIFGENGFFGQNDVLSVFDFFWGNLSLAIGALLISVFVGWVWGGENAVAEIARGSNFGGALAKTWVFLLRYVLPILIFIVLVNVFRGGG